MEKDVFPIGRVVKPHGLLGKMKLEYYGGDLAQFSSYREILIEGKTGGWQAYTILEATPQPPRILLRLRGIEKIEDVQPLVGREVGVRREALPALDENEYFWFEILGMSVETEEGRRIGTVKEILPTTANDLYVIEGKRRELYLPATEEVIREVDRERRVIRAVRVEGLWEEDDEI
jgi:16S rRNA processing protein RimM